MGDVLCAFGGEGEGDAVNGRQCGVGILFHAFWLRFLPIARVQAFLFGKAEPFSVELAFPKPLFSAVADGCQGASYSASSRFTAPLSFRAFSCCPADQALRCVVPGFTFHGAAFSGVDVSA